MRRLVVHVGDLRGETWELGQQSAAGVASYGAACAGSFGLPRLHARGRPLQGSRWFGFQVSSLVPGTPALLGVGVRAANVAVGGGCTLLVDRPELLLGVADGRGGLDVALPIPDVPAVRGLALHAQGVALDSRGAFANLLSFTSALRVDVDR